MIKHSKHIIILIFLLTSFNIVSALDQNRHAKENHTSKYNNIDFSEGDNVYTLTLKNSNKKIAKGAVKKDFYIAKSEKEKDEIYLRVAELLPAGTVFRVSSAHDDDNDDLEISLDTLEPLDKDEILKLPGVVKFEYRYKNIDFIDIIYSKPDPVTESLPTGWTKTKGYNEILKKFDTQTLVKVSVVFSNPDNDRLYWMQKPFYPVIQKLLHEEIGAFYGLGYSDDNLAWWTQDISVEQTILLYEDERVINLIPRN